MTKLKRIAPSHGRRQFLKVGTLTATGAMAVPALAKPTVEPSAPERQLMFYNTHTGEALRSVYWANGEYDLDALKSINQILRDHRTDEIHPIETGLLDLLYRLRTALDAKREFHVISGYRSPRTNARLASKSEGVATRSLHMLGMAIDLRIPGCELQFVQRAAQQLLAGGVGYYPRSDFVHVDVGRVRSW